MFRLVFPSHAYNRGKPRRNGVEIKAAGIVAKAGERRGWFREKKKKSFLSVHGYSSLDISACLIQPVLSGHFFFSSVCACSYALSPYPCPPLSRGLVVFFFVFRALSVTQLFRPRRNVQIPLVKDSVFASRAVSLERWKSRAVETRASARKALHTHAHTHSHTTN